MLKRIFKMSTIRSILGSKIYDNYFKDFILGFCFQINKVPRTVSVRKASALIQIDSIKDYLTVNEIFNWEIYKTPRWYEYKHIVDIGANIGCASLFLCNQPNVESLIAIEPNEEVLNTLRVNLNNNIKGISLEIMTVAIGEFSGSYDFFLSDSSRYSGFVKSKNFNYVNKVQVNCIDFQSLLVKLENYNPLHTLIKIDIEGVEKDFFKFLSDLNTYIGDIIVEGDDLPEYFGSYVCLSRKFNDVYYYTEK